MRKQELVHLHALCALVRDCVESDTDVPNGAFDRYEESHVAPTAIHRGKHAHRRAVLRLAADVASVLSDEPASATHRPLADGGESDSRDSDSQESDDSDTSQ